MTTEPNGIVEPIHEKAMPVTLMTPDDVDSAGTADLLQAMHQGPALREQLHRPQREVQATVGVRMLTRLCLGGARNGNRDACSGRCGNICWGKAERERERQASRGARSRRTRVPLQSVMRSRQDVLLLA